MLQGISSLKVECLADKYSLQQQGIKDKKKRKKKSGLD